MLKKYIGAFLMAIMLFAMVPLFATTASAQTRRYYTNRSGHRVYYKRANFYRRHRKAINIGGGAAAGALVGGLIGGRKGVIIGGLAGAGGGAIFTHKQKPKHHPTRVVRRY